MVKLNKAEWKANYFSKLQELMGKYSKVMLVGVDNVGSNQMQKIRIALRGKGDLLLGKNTMMRKCIRDNIEQFPEYEKLLPSIVGNIGFLFTDGDLGALKDLMDEYKVAAPAKVGAIAQCDVHIPKGNTGLPPDKTNFFQALAIPTKISMSSIEILNDIHLIVQDEKVGASEAALLNMLNISPFSYGLELKLIYDNGSVYTPEILAMTNEVILGKFMAGVANVAAASLSIDYPTLASVPHSIAKGFKNVLAIAVAADIDFPEAEKCKAYLKDPSAFVVAAAPAAAAPAAAAAAAPAPAPVEESDEDMGFGLFD